MVWDAQDAGTSFRFLTSFLAIKKEHVVLSGTERMKQRPVRVLVDALNKIGAEILYLENEGFPPIYVKGKINQVKHKLDIPGDISSQYISSLLLIAPLLEKGIEINIEEPFYSRPYVHMTLNLMGYFGINYPEQYGGMDLDLFYTVIFLEELQKVNSGGFAAAMWAHAYLAMTHLNKEGNHEQKENS